MPVPAQGRLGGGASAGSRTTASRYLAVSRTWPVVAPEVLGDAAAARLFLHWTWQSCRALARRHGFESRAGPCQCFICFSKILFFMSLEPTAHARFRWGKFARSPVCAFFLFFEFVNFRILEFLKFHYFLIIELMEFVPYESYEADN